jgi:hypothetical protein
MLMSFLRQCGHRESLCGDVETPLSGRGTTQYLSAGRKICSGHNCVIFAGRDGGYRGSMQAGWHCLRCARVVNVVPAEIVSNENHDRNSVFAA